MRHHKPATAKQLAVYQFILDTIQATGHWPTYTAIKEHFGYASPHSVTQNLRALAKKGYLTYGEDGYHINLNQVQRAVA